VELLIDTIGKEEEAAELLRNAGYNVQSDATTGNVFHLDDDVDKTAIEAILIEASIEFQWPDEEDQDEDADDQGDDEEFEDEDEQDDEQVEEDEEHK